MSKKPIKLLKPIFESAKIKKIGQNLKYDMLVLSNYGVWTQGVDFDSMVAAYVVNADMQIISMRLRKNIEIQAGGN